MATYMWTKRSGQAKTGISDRHRFISPALVMFYNLGLVHTAPEEFENATLILRLGLPSTLIRDKNGAFRKRSSNRRNSKTTAFRFSVDRKRKRNFLKTM